METAGEDGARRDALTIAIPAFCAVIAVAAQRRPDTKRMRRSRHNVDCASANRARGRGIAVGRPNNSGLQNSSRSEPPPDAAGMEEMEENDLG